MSIYEKFKKKKKKIYMNGDAARFQRLDAATIRK